MQSNLKRIRDITADSLIPDGEYAGIWSGREVHFFAHSRDYQAAADLALPTSKTQCRVIVVKGAVTVRSE